MEREKAFEQGAFFIIIGPNGSGKTTLLKIAAGLLKPKAGQLEIFGKPVGDFPRKSLAKKIAFVPQLITEDLPFVVSDVVLFGRSPHLGTFGLEDEKDVAIASRAMEFTGVAHLAGRRLEQLSGGERQRVFIARALCQEPEIMLLDEPTAALDIAHQLRLMDLMEKMKNDAGVTVIMVSHDINLAAMYGDVLLLLRQGLLVQCGKPEEILTYSTLEDVYGCPLLVDISPLAKFPRVTPVPGRFLDAAKSEKNLDGT